MYDALAQACDEVDDDRRHSRVRAARRRRRVRRRHRHPPVHRVRDRATTASPTSAAHGRGHRSPRAPVGRPTIAQVHGVAAGGGCVIALTCDLRVCTPAAHFGVPIARTLGNCLSAANLARLVDLIGPARTKDLLFTGRLLDATKRQSSAWSRAWRSSTQIDNVVRELGAVDRRQRPADDPCHERSRPPHRGAVGVSTRRQADDDLIAACYASSDFRRGRQPHFSRNDALASPAGDAECSDRLPPSREALRRDTP